MDFLRMEGELNFLSYMPKDKRLPMFKSWYIGDDDAQDLTDLSMLHRGTKVTYATPYPKSEFIEQVVNDHLLKSTNIKFDDINYFKEGQFPPPMPKEFHTLEDFQNAARSLTAPGTGFISYITDNGINVMLMRIILDDGTSVVRSLVINRWHDNVNSLFNGEQSNPKKDTLDIVKGSIGSYPNLFATVRFKDLPDFFDLIKNFDGTQHYKKKIRKYFIGRADDKFWETFDWFQNHFNEADPLQAGLYDLNRYYRQGDKPQGK